MPTKRSIPNIIVSESSVYLKRNIEESKVDPLVPENPKIAEIVNRAQNRQNFVPFANPGYELNRTQSTEGIATKRSLELKKLYLLAGNDNGIAVKKSGSSATLDTKFKSFVDQISEHQKKLNPAPVPSPTMQAFLQNTSPIVNKNEKKSKELSEMNAFEHVCLKYTEKTNNCLKDNETNHKIANEINNQENDNELRPRSPAHETSIIVPEFHHSQDENKIESDSLLTDTSSTDTENDLEIPEILSDDNDVPVENHNLPKLQIHNSQGELMNDMEQQKEQLVDSECVCKYSIDNGFNKIITVPSPMSDIHVRNSEILKHVSTTADLFMNGVSKINNENELVRLDSSHMNHESDCNNDDDQTVGGQTETELSDWARDDDVGVSEVWDDFAPVPIKSLTYRKHQRPKSKRKPRNSPKKRPNEDLDKYGHVCGKIDSENIEFMDTISDNDDNNEHVAALNQTLLQNTGYVEFVTTNPQTDNELKTPVVETLNTVYSMLAVDKDDNDTTTTSDLTTVMDVKNDVEDDVLTPIADTDINKTYHEYVKRLQEKITPFNNIRDSIDIRKMKKTSKGEKLNINEFKRENEQEESNSTIYKLQQITKERMKEKNLIHDMVMSKITGKSPHEKKQRRNRSSPFSSPQSNSENVEFTKPFSIRQCDLDVKVRPSSLFVPINSPLSERKTNNSVKQNSCSETFSLPDIRRALFDEKTPTSSIVEILKSTEEIRENARARARLKSDSELGISPEDKIRQLREKLELRKAVKSECDGLSLLTKSKSCQSIDEFNLDNSLVSYESV